MAERSIVDYPRALRIDAEEASGMRTLYDDSPYPELATALLENARFPTLRLHLPLNRTFRLWIRQTAAIRRAWSESTSCACTVARTVSFLLGEASCLGESIRDGYGVFPADVENPPPDLRPPARAPRATGT